MEKIESHRRSTKPGCWVREQKVGNALKNNKPGRISSTRGKGVEINHIFRLRRLVAQRKLGRETGGNTVINRRELQGVRLVRTAGDKGRRSGEDKF